MPMVWCAVNGTEPRVICLRSFNKLDISANDANPFYLGEKFIKSCDFADINIKQTEMGMEMGNG